MNLKAYCSIRFNIIPYVYSNGRKMDLKGKKIVFLGDSITEVPEIRKLFMPDGLHPNDAEHELITKRLFAFLKNLSV